MLSANFKPKSTAAALCGFLATARLSCCTSEDCEVIVNVTALKIHLSENAHDALKAFPEFITEPRGEIFIKVTYFFAIKMAVILPSFQSVL